MTVIHIGRGRPRKPSSQKALEGTLRADREPGAHGASIDASPIKLPSAPRYLEAEEKKAWRQHAKAIDPRRIVTAGDVAAFELMMGAYFRWRWANKSIRDPRLSKASGPLVVEEKIGGKGSGLVRVKKRPEISVMEKAEDLYFKHATRFGLTPADRYRASSLEDATARIDPLAEFSEE